MKKVASLMAVCAAVAWAQAGRLGGGSVTQDGVTFFWEMRIEPPQPQPDVGDFGTSGPSEDGWIAKAIINRRTQTYFGYEVRFEPEAGGFRASFRPLQMTARLARNLHLDDPANWRTSPVTVPGPQTLHAGDVIAIDLMTNARTGQKIVDYVTVQEAEPKTFANVGRGDRTFSFVGGEARDFRVEDAAIRLREPRLTVARLDGSSAYRSESDVSAPVAWFYVPDRGRYLLSLIPRAGFEQRGELRGTSLRFVIAGETFTLNAAAGLAPGDGAFLLYLRQEPAWRPDSPALFQVGTEARP